jgi:hypothetical protein
MGGKIAGGGWKVEGVAAAGWPPWVEDHPKDAGKREEEGSKKPGRKKDPRVAGVLLDFWSIVRRRSGTLRLRGRAARD